MAVASFRPEDGTVPRLRRDRLTVTLYGSFVTWGWLLYSFNPSVPLLAHERGLSSAQAGLHGTAMALGGLVAAVLAPRSVQWWGRRTAVVAAGVTVAVGVVGLVLGPALVWTLLAMLVLATGGNVLIASSQVGLALRHGRVATAAITEANGVGSGVGLFGPLAVGAAVAVGWGWRPAVLVTAGIALVGAVFVLRLPSSAALSTRGSRSRAPSSDGTVLPLTAPVPVAVGAEAGALDEETLLLTHDEPAVLPSSAVLPPSAVPHVRYRPAAAALLFIVSLVAAIAIENATTYWATALLIDRTGARAGIATAATAGLVAGMTATRFVVGPLSLRMRPAVLLTGAFLVAIAGWAVVWSTTSTAVAMAGLVLAGLGYGAQYPLSIALMLGASPGHGDRVQGYATLAGGAAIGVAPLLLGALADAFGMHTAFVIVPLLACAGAAAAALGGRALRRAEG
ncbi:MFS transporter [Cellulomonas sp. 73-145]|uniref:MFS transporter n=1 Tax=Cellulomonas sp. 73-145 TaxID=1895739 RepID=UPI000B31481F|nr:MFS transporter [Cellulomonas sp. 73-145]